MKASNTDQIPISNKDSDPIQGSLIPLLLSLSPKSVSGHHQMQPTPPRHQPLRLTPGHHQVMESLSMMAAAGYYQFKINYSETKDMSIGKKIISPKFRFGQHDWVIYYYPQGINNKDYNGKYVSVFLVLQRESVDVTAEFSFQLLDKHANIVSPTTSLILLHHTFTSKEIGWGLGDCFDRTKLEQKYIKDDCFVLRVSISVGHDSNIISSLGFPYERLQNFIKEKERTDVTFDVDGNNFVAHRLILAAHSPVFKAELFGSMAESNINRIIQINEMIPSVFEAMLDFMYSCCICINDYKVSISSTEFLQHLVVAADRYEVKRLKVACEYKLIEKISLNTVLSTLELAEIHNCEELKEQCLGLVVDKGNLVSLLLTEGYIKLIQNCPSLLAELNDRAEKLDLVQISKQVENLHI